MTNFHAIDRAKERYGLELTVDDIRDIERRVRTGDVRIVHRDAEAIICEIVYNDVKMQFVYSQVTGHILTFRPLDWSRPEPEYDDWRRAKTRKLSPRTHTKRRKRA